ncbi:MAG: PP2C family serine/threonine-protein phosphatase [Chloroflexota bacterium]
MTTQGAWRIVGASVAGTSHRSRGRPGEDAHGYRLLADGSLALGVADGAGSASRAAAASERAVQAALDFVEQAFADGRGCADSDATEDLLRDTFRAARQALVDLAAARSDPPPDDGEATGTLDPEARLRECATTLLFAIVAERRVVAGQIGDGAIVVGDGAGRARLLTGPDHGEYLNETAVLSAPDFLERVRFAVSDFDEPLTVAILTDGLEIVALNWATGQPHAPFFGPLWDFAGRPGAGSAELVAFLTSERLSRYTDDDKTLVLAVPCSIAPADEP